MNQDANRLIIQVVRFGLPLTVLVFYVTASRNFGYTPEATFICLRYAGDFLHGDGLIGPSWSAFSGTPHPLWVLFISGGGVLGLDLLLTAQIFSVFFSCLTLLLTFLVGVEVLSDRLIALCASLVVAVAPQLLQTAPSGGAAAIGIVLSLGVLFFHLRRDTILSVFLAGLCTLLYWQAAALVVLLLLHTFLTAGPGRSRTKLIAGQAHVCCSILVPWVMIGIVTGADLLPLSVTQPAAMSLPALITWGLLLALAIGGVVSHVRDRGSLRQYLETHGVPLVWVVWLLALGFVGFPELRLLALPVVVIYGFEGLKLLVKSLFSGEFRYVPVFVTAALLMLANQTSFRLDVEPGMVESTSDVIDLVAVAGWVRGENPSETSIRSEQPWTVGYFSRCPVEPLEDVPSAETDLIVTSRRDVAGFMEMYRPTRELVDGLSGRVGRYAVWKRLDTIMVEENP